MRNYKDIVYNYLPSKPDDPKTGDVYQSGVDESIWVFVGERWYNRTDLDIESLIRHQRNNKINDILDDK